MSKIARYQVGSNTQYRYDTFAGRIIRDIMETLHILFIYTAHKYYQVMGSVRVA